VDVEVIGNEDLELALVQLAKWLEEIGYSFVTVTPATHERVLARSNEPAHSLSDVFGWSRPFSRSLLLPHITALLESAELLDHCDGLLRSRIRVSSLGGSLYVHSSYPTRAADAVFFGPDTYRFAALIKRTLHARAAIGHIVDIGCGAGAGGITAVKALDGSQRRHVTLADINPMALLYARVNARLANVCNITTALSDVFENVSGRADLIVANPPYLVDAARRAYRHGGGNLGSELSVRIVREALARLTPGGTLILYTGAPVVAGVDKFREAIASVISDNVIDVSYEEIDPDVFGEELENVAYSGVDRIAAVALVARMPLTESEQSVDAATSAMLE